MFFTIFSSDFFNKVSLDNETTCSLLKTAGSRPGILYGLPKIHKQGVPMRLILCTTGTHNYMSKWLVPKLSINQYSVKDSFSFVKDKNNNLVMTSFDVKSLFTNISIEEVYNIILNKSFPHNDNK